MATFTEQTELVTRRHPHYYFEDGNVRFAVSTTPLKTDSLDFQEYIVNG